MLADELAVAEENYFRYACTRFALDSYAAAPDDPDRMVPNPAKKTAAARIRAAEAAARDAALLQLRSPAPGGGFNAETILARALDGHYARARNEACALIREPVTTSGDICPGPGPAAHPARPARRAPALAALCDQLTASGACYPGTGLVLRKEVKSRPNPA